jgi:hypothetical protein
MKIAKPLLFIFALSISLAAVRSPTAMAFTPATGDHFSFYEVTKLGNGTGPDYNGYTEQTTTNGMESINNVFSNGTVLAHYSFSWTTVNNVGPSTPGSSSNNYTFSSTSFLYLVGTDNQSGYGYVNPTVWFAMDNSLPVGSTFRILNTLMTVESTSYTYHIPSPENRNVNTILAEGSSSYQRKDSYGSFSATYTWNAYFDPSSGYIVGYNYSEQDTNSTNGDGFSWSDQLYVTSTSYSLTVVSTPAGSSVLAQYLGDIIIVVILVVIIIIIAVALSRRRRKLPKHSPQQFPPPGQYYRPPQGPPPQIDLTPKQPPVEQIVVKEVVKVKCQYCGALMDGTLQSCPFCGAPRT